MAQDSVFKALHEMAQQWDDGNARYWVNDSGPTLDNGTLTYGVSDKKHVDPLYGIVDEASGGMIMFAERGVAEEMCDKLNVLASIERLITALNPKPMPWEVPDGETPNPGPDSAA